MPLREAAEALGGGQFQAAQFLGAVGAGDLEVEGAGGTGLGAVGAGLPAEVEGALLRRVGAGSSFGPWLIVKAVGGDRRRARFGSRPGGVGRRGRRSCRRSWGLARAERLPPLRFRSRRVKGAGAGCRR